MDHTADSETLKFLKSLGFPNFHIHHSFNHFDFTRPSRRILVIGPMGSGKTEYSARVWRDSQVTVQKSAKVAEQTSKNGVDRREVFFIRSLLDAARFPDYPGDALAYRGGYERCGEHIAQIRNSFELEKVIERNNSAGTWIIDEASFYDERLAYVVRKESVNNGRIFIFPTLILNFRKDIFNSTAELILENATDIFPLTAYCEHSDCLEDSFFTYRYYTVEDQECPALYFDPLIIIGGDTRKNNPLEPNYCTRCDRHHYLPGKEYTFFTLKPLGEQAAAGNIEKLKNELLSIKNDLKKSIFYSMISSEETIDDHARKIHMNCLKVPCIAEKAVMYLFAEQNLLTEDQMIYLIRSLGLDKNYIEKTLHENRRPINGGKP
jgi:thymidine kinase